jgi:hypothetical protein
MTPPLVPPDTVIPRLPWVPIYADRLWESNFWGVATDAEFRAAFCLWLKSWNQKPPGSLPTDDRILCRLAELGGNLRKWKKVKPVALRHWIQCDDGRLYHPTISELVLDAHEKLRRGQERTSAATANRWNGSNTNVRNGDRNALRNGDRNDHPHGSVDGDDLKIEKKSPPKSPPRHGGDQGFSKNGVGGPHQPTPINPKILHHTDPCHCDNCTRWAALHP